MGGQLRHNPPIGELPHPWWRIQLQRQLPHLWLRQHPPPATTQATSSGFAAAPPEDPASRGMLEAHRSVSNGGLSYSRGITARASTRRSRTGCSPCRNCVAPGPDSITWCISSVCQNVTYRRIPHSCSAQSLSYGHRNCTSPGYKAKLVWTGNISLARYSTETSYSPITRRTRAVAHSVISAENHCPRSCMPGIRA